MSPITFKIKKKMLKNGDSVSGLAARWGFTRHLLTKVIYCERGSGPEAAEAQEKLARYLGTTREKLFGSSADQKAA